jgi:hypothetical protein
MLKEDKILIEQLKISPSCYRKFFYVITTDKERRKILNEASFYKTIYNGVEQNKILEAVINKYIKMKIHNRFFIDPNKKSIEEFIRERDEYIENIIFS